MMTNYDYYDYLINKSNQKVDEGEDGTVPGDDHDSGRASQCEYRWKRRIPASRSERDKTAQLTLFCFYFGDNLMCLPGLVRSSKPGEREKTASLATRFFPSTSTVTMRPAGGYKINWTSETDHTGTVARETTLNRWGQEHEKDALKKLEQILGVQVPSYSHNYIVVVVISRL